MSLLDEYQNRLERRERSEETKSGVQRIFQRFEEWCKDEGIRVERITPAQMEAYFAQLPFMNSTKHRHLVNIRGAYRYALERGVISVNPTIDVYIRQPRERLPRVLSIEDLRAMKERCPDRRAVLHFHMLAYTGMRRTEIRTLPWENVDLPNRTINVIGKNDKRRQVPIHPALGEILVRDQELSRSKWLFPGLYEHQPLNSTEPILRSYTNSATNHDFRRTVSSSLDANGVDEAIINDIMGWSSRTIFARHYRRVAPERLQQAMLSLYADDPL